MASFILALATSLEVTFCQTPLPKVSTPGDDVEIVIQFAPNDPAADPAITLPNGIRQTTITREGRLGRSLVETWDGIRTEIWLVGDWVIYRSAGWKPGKFLPLQASDPLAAPYSNVFSSFADLVNEQSFRGEARLGKSNTFLFERDGRSLWLDVETGLPTAYTDGTVTRTFSYRPKGQQRLDVPPDVRKAIGRFRDKFHLDIRP